MPLFFRRRKAPESNRRTVKRARKQQKRLFRRALKLAFHREIRLFLVIFLGYFLQVTFFSTLGSVLGVPVMFTHAVIAVITVCYGRLRAFWCGLIYGILMELMLPGTELLNLFVYPASALLWSVPFSDKSAQQLEYERSIGRAGRNRSPVLRTLMCSFTNALTFEIVNIVYIYLRESAILPVHYESAVRTVAATVILTLLVLFPLRWFFGYARRQQPSKKLYPYKA
ncbi:MAG: hypothetical protein K6A68_06985 [Clostridiales bacterium]|nr:hypothetical protein [Clostridiales bacterium]